MDTGSMDPNGTTVWQCIVMITVIEIIYLYYMY